MSGFGCSQMRLQTYRLTAVSVVVVPCLLTTKTGGGTSSGIAETVFFAVSAWVPCG